MDRDPRSAFETRAVTDGEEPFGVGCEAGDVTAPIHLSSTYALPGLDTELALEDVDPDRGEFLYTRLSNPTRHALEQRLASLEGGDHAMAFSSGTAAIFTTLLSCLEPGDHLIAGSDLYAGTRRMIEATFRDRLHVDVTFVEVTDTDAIEDAVTDETALIWVETPTNPRMTICDVRAVADIAERYDTRLGVDNTFASSYFQRPLELGADVVAHSTTKYLNGHSDSLGGAVITNDDDLAEEIAFQQQVGIGDVLAPFDSFLVLRGLKTLPLRMRQHEENATEIATYLENHEAVSAVYYPGLESHPQHELARQQMDGFSGILSFELEGDLDDAKRFLEALEEFTLAVSLGGVESLIESPAAMTHEPIPREELEAIGITDTLIRVSVGVEAVEDLLTDLERGFAALEATSPIPDDD